MRDGLLALHPAHGLAEGGVVEDGRRGAVSPTTRSTAPSSSPPSGTDASAGFGTCSASSRTAPSAAASTASRFGQLGLQRAGRFDQRGALLGRGLADRLRRRVLPGAQLLDQSQRIPPRGVGREHGHRSGRARPACARCPRGTPGSSRSRRRSITGVSLAADLVAQAVEPRGRRRATRWVTAFRRTWPSSPATG